MKQPSYSSSYSPGSEAGWIDMFKNCVTVGLKEISILVVLNDKKKKKGCKDVVSKWFALNV